MDTWFAPWRYSYLVSGGEQGGCLLCRIRDSREDRENLVLWRGPETYVVINRYPYNNGHLMIVPRLHCESLVELAPAARAELMEVSARCEGALRSAYAPEGLNLGINLGRGAGAGIAGHIHLHVLPRWGGDTNFMTVLGETRVIPEELSRTWERLRPLLAGEEQGGGGEGR